MANSWGAYIALVFALQHPTLVRSLVLGEPPVLSLLPRTAVGEGLLQSWLRRVIEPSRKAFQSGDHEEGLRRFWHAVCGDGCYDKIPQSRRAVLVKTQAPELRSQLMTDPSANLPPLDCGALGGLNRPTLLVTGERTLGWFFLVTAELERCLAGEAHVMVPDAGHGPHGENSAFYNQAVGECLAASLAVAGEDWRCQF